MLCSSLNAASAIGGLLLKSNVTEERLTIFYSGKRESRTNFRPRVCTPKGQDKNQLNETEWTVSDGLISLREPNYQTDCNEEQAYKHEKAIQRITRDTSKWMFPNYLECFNTTTTPGIN
jgi:hypothetical protein